LNIDELVAHPTANARGGLRTPERALSQRKLEEAPAEYFKVGTRHGTDVDEIGLLPAR